MKSVFISYAITQLLLLSAPSQGVECPDNYYGVDEGITLNECRHMGSSDYEKYWCQDENTVLVGFYKNAECSTGTEWWTAPYECTLEGDIHGLNAYAYPCKCDFTCPDPASNSVVRITSDCAGNEIENKTVTIDECQFEPFSDGPSRPFKYFCDDGNQLGLKYYTTGLDNCDGTVQLETILDSAGQCVDGFVFSSTCGQSTQSIPMHIRVTKNTYKETEDLPLKVQNEFGNEWEILDWNILKNEMKYDEIHYLLEYLKISVKGINYFLTMNGKQFYGSKRRYFIQRHNKANKEGWYPRNWLIHDDIGNHMIDLGSWYDINGKILVIRKLKQ